MVLNKIDKVETPDLDFIRSNLEAEGLRVIPLSAKTGTGLDELQRSIVQPFAANDLSAGGFLVTDARHHDLLQRTAAEISNSLGELDAKMSEEVVLIGLHNALRYLGQITGETTTDDMLTRIFETFCIGK